MGPTDYVALIKACRENGATKLKVGDLEIEFTPQFAFPVPTAIVPLEVGDNPPEIDKQDEDLAKEQRAAELLMADPEAYEAEMGRGYGITNDVDEEMPNA